MTIEDEQKAETKERKRWLATLLDRMTAPADVMRQHLVEEDQRGTLGSAAEFGVRDILRSVLPQRLAVTSGFLRAPGRSLTENNPRKGAVSPQTDVIVYDASQATPLHSIGGIDIVAATDVLGAIEVKDTIHGSEDLATAKGEGGALGHTVRLGVYAPYAFRGIVLFRGKEIAAAKKPKKESESEKKPRAETDLAQERFTAAGLQSYQAPHVVYCASYATGDGAEGSYLAFYDFLAKTVCIHEYHGDRTPALASFLRIVTGFFAARGLISPSLHLDLLPTRPLRPVAEVPATDADSAFDGLHRRLLDRRAEGERTPLYKLFVNLLKDRAATDVKWYVATGRDAAGLPTAGFIVLSAWEDQSQPVSAAFFYLVAPNVFACTDAAPGEEQRWVIEDEAVDDYMRRALRESGRDPASNAAPGRPEQPSGTSPEPTKESQQ